MESFLPLALFLFLGFKGYLQASCLQPLARVGESDHPATGVSSADKQRRAWGEGQLVRDWTEGGDEIWRTSVVKD